MNEKVKILVCEDNSDHRMLIMDSLEEHLPDAEYFEAETGSECIKLIESIKPEVLILDYRLGDMDGIQILESIGSMISRIAVLLVTSQGDEKIAVQAMKMGARDYLVKDMRLAFIDHIPISVHHALQQIVAEREKENAQKKLKTSEELNRMILDQMAEAVIFADKTDQIVKLNGIACTLFNTEEFTKEELEARKLKLSDRLFQDIIPEITDLLNQLKSNLNIPFSEKECVMNGKILSVRMSPVRDKDENYRGVIINIADISERRKEEKERLEAIDRTVSALAKAVELRDAYTSGHAASVASIASRIAKHLNWNEQRIIGIELAAELHDIGKIAIPAEILTRPTRLSSLEKQMLQEHPQKGYEILKEVKFPFPVAETVYQHHEALDGSGYPRGLKGDQITPEARVLAVADVLDAITSFRPYREGLGIDNAIEYLKKNRGVLFDPLVVDAAIELISKAGNQPFWKKRQIRSKQNQLHRYGSEPSEQKKP